MHSSLTFTSDEINYLIYRYLKESGFEHTCFTFAYESRVLQSSDYINPRDVKPGSLINVIQKGLQYMEVEAHVKEDGLVIECDQPISLVKPHKCTPIDPMELDMYTGGTHIPANLVTTLEGHNSEVFNCAWNPKYSLLASGSGDGTARLWKIIDGLCGRAASEEASRTATVLNHQSESQMNNCHITTLDWSNEGNMLATGSYDGIARIWDWRGDLILSLKKHKGAIFSLKWSPDNQYLLSGSLDRSAIVWDVNTGNVVQQFEEHKRPTLDVDWKDSESFATCSSDTNIYVWEIGQKESTKMFRGHNNEVNAIRWDPQGRLLASCSDDTTAKIWSMESDSPLYDLTDHTKEIYTIKWSPTGEGSPNPNRNLILASASFDSTVKLWDAERGTVIHDLTKHHDQVYAVAFSPDGQYVASGSIDKCLHIWSVQDGSLIKTYKGDSYVYDVSWNSEGDKVAACFASHKVSIVDFKM